MTLKNKKNIQYKHDFCCPTRVSKTAKLAITLALASAHTHRYAHIFGFTDSWGHGVGRVGWTPLIGGCWWHNDGRLYVSIVPAGFRMIQKMAWKTCLNVQDPDWKRSIFMSQFFQIHQDKTINNCVFLSSIYFNILLSDWLSHVDPPGSPRPVVAILTFKTRVTVDLNHHADELKLIIL